MTSKFKALGLAFFAVFAFSAIAATAAQAAEEFHSETSPTIITGTSEEGEAGWQVFTVPGSEAPVICRHAHFSGTLVGENNGGKTNPTITVHPEYSGNSENTNGPCEFAGNEAVVHTNECNYTLAAATTGSPAMANVEVTCGAKPIEITVPALGIQVNVPGGQNLTDAVSYTNTGTGSSRDVTVKATATNIKWSCSGSHLICTIGLGATEGTGATYSGNVNAKGFKDEEGVAGAQVGIWKE